MRMIGKESSAKKRQDQKTEKCPAVGTQSTHDERTAGERVPPWGQDPGDVNGHVKKHHR